MSTQQDAPRMSAEDWQLVLLLCDVQRKAVGIYTALYRIRAIVKAESAGNGNTQEVGGENVKQPTAREAAIRECANVLDAWWRELDGTTGAALEAQTVYDARNRVLALLLPEAAR